MQLNRFMIRPLVEQGLREEIGLGDTTGGFLVGDDLADWLAAETEVDALLLGDDAIQSSR